MNGKELKVLEYNLTFGSAARMVNVFGLFRYVKNNGLYVLYTDVGTMYPIVYYGSSHIKENSILSMGPKPEDVEIIKEYIYKVTNGEELEGFEVLSLKDIDGIEIISSARLEVNMESLNSLIDKTIPKKEVVKEEGVKKSSKKKGGSKFLLIFLLLIGLAGGGYYYFSTLGGSDSSIKSITCEKIRMDSSLHASITETNIYNFNSSDLLENAEFTQVFQFDSENYYQDFISRGLLYRYMPDDKDGGFNQNDEEYSFTFVSRENVDANYSKSTKYEEIIKENKRDGYTCKEEILDE